MENIKSLEKIVGTGRVAVVDSTMQFKDFVNWQRAVTMVVTDEAYTLIPNANGKLVRSPSISVELPLVVCLNRFVAYRQNHIMDGQTVSKHTIRTRDKFICQYCDKRGRTIDHIYPKSRGGLNTWDNMCVACSKCNGEKGDRTPQEAGMRVPNIPKTVDNEIQYAVYREIEIMMGINMAPEPVSEVVKDTPAV